MKYKFHLEGQIELGSSVMVSDPCYEMGVWCQGIIENVRPGTYDCLISEGKTMWGSRNCALAVIHADENYDDLADDLINMEEQDFEVGVDSGTAGIFDLAYYKNSHFENSIDEDWYDSNVCEYIDDMQNICDGKGIWSLSGYGDGSYPCYVKRNADGQIIAIVLVFIGYDGEE